MLLMQKLEGLNGYWFVKILILLSFFIQALVSASFDAAQLKKRAEIEGVGYKTANLELLQSLARSLNQAMAPYAIAVPMFVGLSSQEIHAFLKNEGLDLALRWEELLETAAGEHQQKKMIHRKQLSRKMRVELETLQQEIKELCGRAAFFDLPAAADFFTTAKKNEWALMVRSTGKEDSEELANAGGNVSVANVPPSESHIMHAVGEVVASYISAKSLQQRLQAGDTTVFDCPFIPVLMQRMIGEPVGGAKRQEQIPTGCVVYTTETDGLTPGIAVVQATFGHNEGVVQSSMPADTFYLSQGAVYSSIKEKRKRLVPVLSNLQYTLLEQQNPQALVSRSSLESRALKTIRIIATALERYYGKPMDLELVVMPHQQSIYLVQARPIILPKIKATPRYLKIIPALEKLQHFACTVINSNGGALLTDLEASHLIMAKNLEKALVEFNELSDDKDEIKAIIVEEEAEPTSHAAAVLRGEGKVVVKINRGIEDLRSLLDQSDASVVLSTQQGLIIESTHYQEVIEGALLQGWLNHPINLPLSIEKNAGLWASFQLYAKPLVSENPLKIFDDIKVRAACDPISVEKELDLLVSALVSCESPANLAPELDDLHKEMSALMHKGLKSLQHFAHTVIEEIKRASTDAERLFHIRVLELALKQRYVADGVRMFSYKSLVDEFSDMNNFLKLHIVPRLQSKAISQAVVKNFEIITMAKEGFSCCLGDKERSFWLAFIDTHSRNIEHPAYMRLKKLLNHLIEENLLGAWINTSLAQEMHNHSEQSRDAAHHYAGLVSRLAHEFDSAQKQLEGLDKAVASMFAIKPQEWEEPQKIEQLFSRFDREVLSFCRSEKFADLLEHCSQSPNNVLKLAVITALKKMTDQYDLFIKAIKGSTQYQNKKSKILHFHMMLEGYVGLLEQVSDNDELLAALRERLNNFDEDDDDELVVSDHFNVNVVIQQNELPGKFNRQKFFDYIASLEDLFTSTHQLLLTEISKKIVAWRITAALHKPDLVQEIEDTLELEELLTGLRFEGNTVVFTYNRKLRAHSIQIDIAYDCATQKTTLSYHFYGFNEFLRWNIIKDYFALISPRLDAGLLHVLQRDYGLSLYWDVSTIEKVQVLDDLLEDAIDITFELSIENRKTIFDNLDQIFEKLYEKCSEVYGSPEALQQALVASVNLQAPFNLLMLPVLDDIAAENPDIAKSIFEQAVAMADEIIDSEKHDGLVAAHYILAEVALASFECAGVEKIPLPRRIRLQNFKRYKKIVAQLFTQVSSLVAGL